jgi:hypothetical protein
MYILYIKTLKTSSTYLSPMLQRILKPVRFMYICGSFHLLLPATAVIFYDRRTHRFVCFQWRMPWYAMPSSQFLTWSGFVCTCLRIHTYIYLIITRIWLHNIFFFHVWFYGHIHISHQGSTAATQMAAQHHPCIRLSGAGALGSSPCTWPEIRLHTLAAQPVDIWYLTQPPKGNRHCIYLPTCIWEPISLTLARSHSDHQILSTAYQVV